MQSFSVSLIVLLIGANLLVITARSVGTYFNISDIIMGLMLLALGTTIPELTVEIQSILKGVSGIAFRDILGSVVCNSTLVLGLASIINPIVITDMILFRDSALFMVTSVYIALLFIKKKEITWQEGLGLLLVYATFLVTTLGEFTH